MITQSPEKFNHHAHATRTTMLLTTRTTKLPDSLRSLCNRLATERHRAAVWTEGQRLREFCRQRLTEGASIVEVTNFLAQQLETAVLAQHNHHTEG